MTLPLDHYETRARRGLGQHHRRAEAPRELWNSVKNDKVGGYLKANPEDELPDPKDVS